MVLEITIGTTKQKQQKSNRIYLRKFNHNISPYQYRLIYESATNLVAIIPHKHVCCVFCIN